MKKITAFIFTFVSVVSAFALEVNKDELQQANNQPVIEFINYNGPHKIIESASSIRGIGTSLGVTISENPLESKSSGSGEKYYVIHAVDETNNKLDADIIFIGSDAQVDHIDNLRRIISGYLVSAYNYSSEDADTLAVFITVYNAVYRGDLKSFENKYKQIVLDNLSENCGLSVNYKDWPGKSEIVIPLFDIKNIGLSTVDTTVISDSKVVTSMKEDDDKNIESRKDMVDLKERESDAAYDNAKAAQKTAAEEQKKLEEEKIKSEELKNDAERAQKEADEKKEIADKNPEDKQAQIEAEEAQKTADEKKEAAEKQEETVKSQEEKTKEAQEAAKQQQSFSDRKQTEAQSERKEIAKDQKEVQDQQEALSQMNIEYGLVLIDSDKLFSKLVKFNSDDGQVIKSSPLSTIRNRTIYKTSDSYIAVAGENIKNAAVKLVLLNPETLEISDESDAILSESSVLIQNENEYYCVLEESEKYYLAKFDEKLTLLLKSDLTVNKASPIIITDTSVVVTSDKGDFKVLNKKDFSTK